MERISPETFTGPRTYFTAFDPRIIKRTKNLTILRKNVERKLKNLLLIKSRIVCAASHLTSKFTYDFFKENPTLLSEGHLIPAFRVDKKDLAELFEKKKLKQKGDAIRFYKDHIKKTVDWELEDNSSWFRQRFIIELEDENSVIRKHLTGTSETVINHLIAEIRAGHLLDRDLIDRFSKEFPLTHRRVLLNYRELVYHMSGARVVNCESSLPQENYIDYDLADLQQKRTRLSEDQILWKLFIELILESLQRTIIPVEMLDYLTFKDILLIRQPLLDSPFQTKYDQLISQVTSETQRKDKGFLYSIHELQKIRQDLSTTFKAVLEKELPSFVHKKVFSQTKPLLSVGSSIGLSVAGFIPGISIITGAAAILKDTPALIFNLGQGISSAKTLIHLNEYFQNKERILRKTIEKTEITDKTPMLDMTHLLTTLITNKIQV